MDIPNHQGPDSDRGRMITGIYACQCSLSLLFLILRIWARTRIHAIGWDDIFMAFTWIHFAILTVFVGILGPTGGFRHVYHLTKEQVRQATKLNWIAQPFGIISIATGKLAVGFLLLRLVPPTSKWRRYSIWTLMTTTTIVSTLAVIFTYAQCRHPAALWDPDVRAAAPGECWDPRVQSDFSIFNGGLNGAVDFIFSFIPVTIVWNLQVSLKRRVGIVVLLGGGVFSGISASLKAKQLAALADRADLTWETFGIYLWTGIEASLMIICGCIPTLKPLWVQILSAKPRRSSSSRGFTTEGSSKTRYDKLQRQVRQERDFVPLGDISDQSIATRPRGDSDTDISVGQKGEIEDGGRMRCNDEGRIHVTHSFRVEYS